MKKRILIMSILIIIVASISIAIGIRLINDANAAEDELIRSLKTHQDAEQIHIFLTKLESLARATISSSDDKEALKTHKVYWKTYNQASLDINKHVSNMHTGECKSCHKAFISIGTQINLINDLLGKINSTALLRDQKHARYKDEFEHRITRIAEQAKIIKRLAENEKNRLQNSKTIYFNTKNLGIKRTTRIAKQAKTIIRSCSSIMLSLKDSNSTKMQIAISDLSDAITKTEIKPPLSGNCYSCHELLASLPLRLQKLGYTSEQLFKVGEGNTESKEFLKFSREITVAVKSAKKVVNLAYTEASKSAKKARNKREQLKTFLVIINITGVLAALSSLIFLMKWFFNRLSLFSKAIEAISEGNYSYVLRVKGNDEISNLANAFNLMANRIRSSQNKQLALNNELQELYLSTIKAFVEAIEAKDPYTRGHSENVAKYSLMLAQELDLSSEQLDEIYVAALLHDIGKIGIKEQILNKPSSLTMLEFEQIKAHPAISAQIVGSIPNLTNIARIIKHHHEQYNGQGYPDGLAGENIPLSARILAIADAFDAMTSKRPYRDPCSKTDAIAELIKKSGSQFDPVLVDVFIKLISFEQEKEGSEELSAA